MRVFVIAGEPSGDALGGALMAGLRQLAPEVTFDGVGGARMQAQGLTSRFEMSELSVMGLAEILPKYRHLKRRISETAQAIIDTGPDLLITIDSPDFCFRVARLVRAEMRVHNVHYVAPSIWAWRPKRSKKLVGLVDHILALLPFEPPLWEAHGIACDFVGHPVVAEPVATAQEARDVRTRHRLGEADPLLLVLPGSRRGEVGRLAPIFGQALSRFAARHPRLRAAVVLAPNIADLVRDEVAGWSVPPVLIPGDDIAEKRAAFRAADMALAASGTVALELAAAGTPMVIGYKVNPLTYAIVKRIALIDTANLVNIVSDTRAVTECLGPDCTAENLALALENLNANPRAQAVALDATMEALGRGGQDPGLRAAEAVLARLP